MGVDEGDYLFGRPSSSVAKKTDAALRMSFALRSSLFSRSSCAIRCASAVEVPGRRPESISARFTQCRNDSAPTPSSFATRVIVPCFSPVSRGSPAPSGPPAHAARRGTSAASAAHLLKSCSIILVSKVRSTRRSQSDSIYADARGAILAQATGAEFQGSADEDLAAVIEALSGYF